MNDEQQLPRPPSVPRANKEYKGYNGTMILTDDCVVIERGAKGYLFGGGYLRGDKSIPYSSIVAVQLKKARSTAGYIQLTLKGGSESKRGLMQSVSDENSINFYHRKNREFLEAKTLIEQRIRGHSELQHGLTNDYAAKQPSVPSCAQQTTYIEELEKLASLRDKGIISEADFEAKKNELLGFED
jgi:hypothetical protein